MLSGIDADGLGESVAVMLFVAPFVRVSPVSVCVGPSVTPLNAPVVVAKYCETKSVSTFDQSKMLGSGTVTFTLVTPLDRNDGKPS